MVAEAADGQEAVETACGCGLTWRSWMCACPAGRDFRHPGACRGRVDVLVLTTFDLDEYVFGALRAGAAGFLLKDVEAAGPARSGAHGGAGRGHDRARGDPRLISEFAGTRPRRPERADPALLERLTPREREVLACIGEGLSNQQIARRLYITETTAKTHVSRILTKLDLRSRVQAAIVAREVGLG